MPHDVTMPQLGMAQDAGKILSWLKSPGDAVAKGDPLFEVETDKATMEVEAQADGFLTGVTAAEGDDVPVGAVMARISDSPDDAKAAPASSDAAPTDRAPGARTSVAEPPPNAPDAALPDGTEVTMPQLGMAQDSGVLVNWLKAPGDAVAKGDPLFEVETDKAVQEIEAQSAGYLAATLVEAGEEVPVGAPVAIVSAEKPEAPVARAMAGGQPQADAAPTPAAAPAPAAATTAPALTPTPATPGPKPAPLRHDGGILASPKARRLALEQGLDLSRLAAMGHPQPFHVADLETLRQRPETSVAPLTAAVRDGFTGFALWARDAAGIADERAILAGFAAGALGRDIIVRVHGPAGTETFAASRQLSAVAPTDAAPDLHLRDLRFGAAAPPPMAPGPVLSLLKAGGGLTATLAGTSPMLDDADAIRLLTDFAGRLEDPLRHLL